MKKYFKASLLKSILLCGTLLYGSTGKIHAQPPSGFRIFFTGMSIAVHLAFLAQGVYLTQKGIRGIVNFDTDKKTYDQLYKKLVKKGAVISIGTINNRIGTTGNFMYSNITYPPNCSESELDEMIDQWEKLKKVKPIDPESCYIMSAAGLLGSFVGIIGLCMAKHVLSDPYL